MAVAPLIKKNFPQIDKDIFDYVSNVLANGSEDFVTADDVFESVGELLLDVSDKSEEDILRFCQTLLQTLHKYEIERFTANVY